ncbi:hypothetical protein A2480_03680 [Candidatus Uhrbacteria bacterium RIFOXYC2_FULL_47_19]|uniref:Uncharacterized protein n=1 Tax=Candidatus Uhrbacteria bacterium RIFOXYC2_FULL_47_19 TaxID=1802424 RepID=A0A1F7WCP0_9BACT|nr:MAG: hypothetical protein A2480_03680 [Candidatus Uhrbacteria bacterium RIFOXYC2_FULL_47_19]
MFPDVDPDLVVVRAEGIGSVCLATLRSPFALVVGQGTVGRTARRGLIFVAGPIAAEGQTDSAVSRTVLTELPITADIVAAVNRTAATIFGAGVTTLVTVAGSIPTEGTDTTVSRAGVAVFVTFADIVATDRRTNAAIRRAGVAVFVTFADIVATDRRTNAAIRCAVVAAFMLVAGSIPTEGTDTAVSRAGVAVFVFTADTVATPRYRHALASIADLVLGTGQTCVNVGAGVIVMHTDELKPICIAHPSATFALILFEPTVRGTIGRRLALVAGTIAAPGRQRAVLGTELVVLPQSTFTIATTLGRTVDDGDSVDCDRAGRLLHGAAGQHDEYKTHHQHGKERTHGNTSLLLCAMKHSRDNVPPPFRGNSTKRRRNAPNKPTLSRYIDELADLFTMSEQKRQLLSQNNQSAPKK